MNARIQEYNDRQTEANRAICDKLFAEIDRNLLEAESKIWHAHPVWFLERNPIAGYSVLKSAVRLLFWSGQSFDEPGLKPEGSFKAAEARYTNVDQVDSSDIARWLAKAREIQWNHRDLMKKKGQLDRLK